jgi:hypothetical protein
MALADLQEYLQERAALYDPTIDLTSGSPYDSIVIQPVLQRLGTDPFTVDMGVFIQDRINQDFPGLATKEGDALTDFLIKVAVVLWDPITRENYRVKQNLSFANPATLTLDEADALGANLFATRNLGNVSTGVVRIYFASPQNISISPANFVTTQAGLNFFPTMIQSISVQEMLYNTEVGLYYFDINVQAEQAGDQYNIDPDSVISIANVGAAVRITNKLRFANGAPAEDAPTFIDRVAQDLTEHSLVTERGIIAQISDQFSSVTRLAVTGYGDPEMQRDIITGGALGPIVAGGVGLYVIPDGMNGVTSSYIEIDTSIDFGIDFTSLVGPVNLAVSNVTLTVFNAFEPGVLPVVQDLNVIAVVSPTVLQVSPGVLNLLATGCPWTLRRNEITLSNIPGGILFPNTPNGEVTIVPNQIHIGGMTDIFIRGTAFDSGTLIISDVVDDMPLLQGQLLTILDTNGDVQLNDLLLGTGGNYSIGDVTYEALAGSLGLTLVITYPSTAAGNYRVIAVNQTPEANPILTLTPAPPDAAGDYLWRLLDEIFIDLVLPKDTLISGTDMITTQGTNVVTTASGTDFQALGVAPGDTVRLLNGGLVMGDYTVVQVLTPLFTRIQVTPSLPATASSVSYIVFQPNAAGGIQLPFVRIDTINLLDTSNQPVGSNIPFANPIDIESNSFANAGGGIKADFYDATLGIVSIYFSSASFSDLGGQTLTIEFDDSGLSPDFSTVTFTTPCTTIAEVVSQINAYFNSWSSGLYPIIAIGLNPNSSSVDRQFGILPVSPLVRVTGGTALSTLFGPADYYTTADIRSASTNFFTLSPAVDQNFDVAQVLDGFQIGFYNDLIQPGSSVPHHLYVSAQFNPEYGRHVQVGSRSLGSVRCYFLEPTSIEFMYGSAVFTLEGSNGSVLNFLPDPTLTYQRIPALPNGAVPMDGSVTVAASGLFNSASSDFILKGVQAETQIGEYLYVGDQLVITYVPVAGSATLTDPVPALALKTLVINLSGGSTDKTITFITDSNAIPSTAVTLAGVATQINNAVGQNICSIVGSSPTAQLYFNPSMSLIIRQTGTANSILGFSTTNDTNNISLNAGTYTIVAVVSETQLQITYLDGATGAPPFVESNEQFYIQRVGVQRIISTTMSTQVAETGLYYFDVFLVSQGTGDQYNITNLQQMSVTGFKSDGYYLTTDNPNLTFSVAELPKLHISPTILEIGVSDDPDNATVIEGQNIQINYDMSSLTLSIQNFVTSDTERVINDNPLARHLIPYFVRTDLTYVGGSQPSVIMPSITALIQGLFPSDYLEVSSLEAILTNGGATSIDNPIDLLAVIHNFDRSVTIERSQDKINTGRLAAFIPDVINLTRQIS